MKREMELLYFKFYEIQRLNWVPSHSKGYGACGVTLEFLLHKKADQAVLADFNGIELKTKIVHSEPYVSLFSMALDDKPMQMKRLYELCGYKSKDNPKYKVFYLKINGKEKVVRPFFIYQLKVNYENQCVHLLIFIRYSMKIYQDMAWSFQGLKQRIVAKLSYLAFVSVARYYDVSESKEYFKYLSITFYQLINFEKFLALIEDGTIQVNIKIGYHKSGPKLGTMYDKGTTFEIKEEDLEKLFRVCDVSLVRPS